jgi:hypothetical protein
LTEADAAAWVVKRISAALEQAERAGTEAALLALRLGDHGGAGS